MDPIIAKVGVDSSGVKAGVDKANKEFNKLNPNKGTLPNIPKDAANATKSILEADKAVKTLGESLEKAGAKQLLSRLGGGAFIEGEAAVKTAKALKTVVGDSLKTLFSGGSLVGSVAAWGAGLAAAIGAGLGYGLSKLAYGTGLAQKLGLGGESWADAKKIAKAKELNDLAKEQQKYIDQFSDTSRTNKFADSIKTISDRMDELNSKFQTAYDLNVSLNNAQAGVEKAKINYQKQDADLAYKAEVKAALKPTGSLQALDAANAKRNSRMAFLNSRESEVELTNRQKNIAAENTLYNSKIAALEEKKAALEQKAAEAQSALNQNQGMLLGPQNSGGKIGEQRAAAKAGKTDLAEGLAYQRDRLSAGAKQAEGDLNNLNNAIKENQKLIEKGEAEHNALLQKRAELASPENEKQRIEELTQLRKDAAEAELQRQEAITQAIEDEKEAKEKVLEAQKAINDAQEKESELIDKKQAARDREKSLLRADQGALGEFDASRQRLADAAKRQRELGNTELARQLEKAGGGKLENGILADDANSGRLRKELSKSSDTALLAEAQKFGLVQGPGEAQQQAAQAMLKEAEALKSHTDRMEKLQNQAIKSQEELNKTLSWLGKK